MKLSRRLNGRRFAALVAGICLGAVSFSSMAGPALHGKPLDAHHRKVEVFVRLSTPAVSELNIQSLAATGKMASDADQKAQAARVSAQQATFRGEIAGLGAKELSALRVGANGLRLRLPASEVDQLRSLPGVLSVGPVEIHKIDSTTVDNITSVPWIGAVRAAQEYGLTGTGIRIAIIDTGIDYLHADFRKDGTAGDYAGNNPDIVEPGTFPTAKVVGGWDFAGPTYQPGDVPQPDADPLDGIGHGTHVAGTAAGYGVPGSVGPGVAPDAKLYALKVFNDTGGSTDLTSDAIEWAMDPNGDGSMSDHVDVINMSLGAPFGEPTDPSAIASNNAVKVGIVVVASAGNEGDVPYVTGAPAVASKAISVAATIPGGRVYSRVNVTAPASVAGYKANLEGAGPIQLQDVGPISGGVVAADPADGCSALNNAADMVGKIALVVRGTCTFDTKFVSAQSAGATAIIVYNDGAGPTRIDPITMAVTSVATIPGVMISYTDGSAVAAVATTAADSPVMATLDAAPNPTMDDKTADFSSRGPASNEDSSFKPDLAAPGVNIVSAAVGSRTGGISYSGTSMASPHVAGAAALLRQEHPDLPPAAIKALLQNATVDGNPSGDTDLTRLGVGVVRVDKAAGLSSYASPAGVSFGRINPRVPVWTTEDVTLSSLTRGSRTFSVTHVAHRTYPGVTVVCPDSVSIRHGRDTKFRIGLRFDPAAAAAAGQYDNASISQTEVDGWCDLSDGTDTLRVGYIAVVDPASGMQVHTAQDDSGVDVRNRGPAFGFAEGFTLAPYDRSSSGTMACQQGRHGDRGWNDGGSDNGDHSNHGRHDDSAPQPGDNGCMIANVGFRTADPNRYYGEPVAEFGIALQKSYQHISNLEFDLYIDANKDGIDDYVLVAADYSYFGGTIGTYVTAQFPLQGQGPAYLDWIVGGWDYNDRVVVLPFTLAASPYGYLPSSFNYRLEVYNRQGSVDTQAGSIDLADELTPDLNSFGLDGGQTAHINVSGGRGEMLWLFPNNTEDSQDDTVRPASDRSHHGH